ncbi:unnamed protein product [Eruca vesicaria subsp. sativa]|uniref:Uncharacterized protein n=1 Tax=Eruca vesicaria subsp. sativa TaxID=29727 RepID=A0ABC8KLR3_ERUVS|nr:unnamed protein product [Eruca vesicaria subsp. sativa]
MTLRQLKLQQTSFQGVTSLVKVDLARFTRQSLDWTQRYKIIGGIARGILYLHQDSQLTIIHRDLKASNILLDANMNPKISDFGLSTIFGMEQTRGNTSRIAGTHGYMSPEYAMHGQYSMKSDIYSFGVLVLEIISGKKNSCVYQMDETSTHGNLVTYAWRLWKNGSPLELVDLAIGRNYQSNEVTRCIHIALLCVQENPEDRPMLSTIILMLTSNTITLPVPRLPTFIPQSRHELEQLSEGLESSRLLESSQSTGRSITQTCMDDNGHFRPNSTYDTNRRLILSLLPSNVTSKEGLFFNGSIGQEPNRVYAVGMCIPGSTSDDCSDCIKTASDDLIQNCPNQTNAFTWPGDPTLCYVRYSNTSFLGSANLYLPAVVYNTGDITSNLTEFTTIWENLVVRMIDAASLAKSTPSSSNNHYKADVASVTSLQNIYALMQCTPDLSSGDCDNCLRQSARDYKSCCGQKQGGVVMRPSCFFRWDIKGISSGVVAAITIPTAITVFILLVLGVFLCRRRKSMQRTEVESNSDISTTHSSQYDFKTIEAATNKFSWRNKLGEGGFGEVYKGTLSNGTEVAVKRLSKKSGQGIREFKNEAVLVSKLQHRNLVRLLGFCLEGDEKILIYEFVPNKSLNHFLFHPEKQSQLDWTKRYKIIGGIARGILYLHQDSLLTIIHRDLKASNILLDANMNAKISDFGLSTIFRMEQTRGNTNRIAGTYGYMSPEYAMHGQYSMKSDIYSFGVLVLEIISGKKNSGGYLIDETSTYGNLVTYAWSLWRNESPLELVDPAIERNYQSNEITRCIHIALLCVQDNPEDRPMLSTIILMLTSDTITLPVPRLPSFIPRRGNELDSEGLESSQSTGRSVGYSVNDVSITDLEAR